MKELLALCGFSPLEIQTQLPRMQTVCPRFGIAEEDVSLAKQRLMTYYAIDLKGVRKVLRLCLLEFLDSILAREEGRTRILTGFMAPAFDIIGAAAMACSPQVYSAHQSWALQLVVGCIFNKLEPLLEAAEKKWLKAGMVAHCGNVKTLLGSVVLDLIPKPDLMVTSGFMCETAPKTLDLLHQIDNIPVACFDTCFDRHDEDYALQTRRTIDFAARSLRVVVARVAQIVGCEISDELLLDTIRAKDPLNQAWARIARLIADSDPMPLSATHSALWMCLNSLTMNAQRLGEAIEALDLLYEELQERVGRGLGAVKKGAPRVLALLPAQHADPRFEHLAGEVGIAIVSVDLELSVPFGGMPDDPYAIMCLGLSHSLITSLSQRIPLIIKACRTLKVDGVLDRYHVGCRSVVGDAFIVQSAVKKELGLPVLLLEWENFDPRVFHYQEYKKKLEIFKAMMEK